MSRASSTTTKSIVFSSKNGLTRRDIDFLTYFSENMELKDVAEKMNLPMKTVRAIAEKKAVKAQLEELMETYQHSWRLSASQAAGRHVKLMDKMEKFLDDGDSKVAASLARMSSDMLKATGYFDQAEGEKASSVSVSINIGGVEGDAEGQESSGQGASGQGITVQIGGPAAALPKAPGDDAKLVGASSDYGNEEGEE